MTGPLLSPLLSWLLWGGLLAVGALALRSMATRGWYCRLGHCHRTALDADLCDAEHYEPRRLGRYTFRFEFEEVADHAA